MLAPYLREGTGDIETILKLKPFRLFSGDHHGFRIRSEQCEFGLVRAVTPDWIKYKNVNPIRHRVIRFVPMIILFDFLASFETLGKT